MGRLSPQLRDLIVKWRYEQGLSVSEIADLAECHESSVYRLLSIHRVHGQTTNPLARPRGRQRVLDMTHLNYIRSLLLANPTLYLDELQSKLLENCDVDLSIATISRALRRMAMSNKRVSKAALERNELLRATWQAAYGHISAECMIWLDESSVDDSTNQRKNGWADLGRACVRRATFIRGKRYSVLPAFTADGYVGLDIFEGSVTKERFIQFVSEQVAPRMTPYPGPRSVVVLDNCAIHHDEEVRRIVVDDCGGKLIYLPPYSPDFNPIEQSFHSLKAWLRRHEAEAVNADVRPWLIHQAAASITSDDAEGWILNCGYSFF